ncbi:MAG: AarF/UbiB family protein [Sphingomonadaceae bacterium]|nr:AarF/UbiB family protein [Sphingomonadaceae bacterium]
MVEAGHAWRLLSDARRLAAHGVLRPFEDLPDLPPGVRLVARLLRAGTLAPREPDYSGGLRACGPAAVKLGQALATRPDLVGEAAAADLRRLQDDLPPDPWDRIEAELDRALPGGWRAHFAWISPEPAGSASIAQVHRARTRDGREVALKVLRPGVERRFRQALAAYDWAAAWLETLGGEFRRLRPRHVLATFRAWTMAELDLRREAGNASELAQAVRGEPGIRVPKVHWEWTSRRTLALDWVDGVKLTDMAAVDRAGADRRALARAVVGGFLEQAIGHGFFHADLHQGNLILCPDGRIALLDFGIMGRLDRRARVYLAEILWGLIRGDYARVAELHFEAGYVPPWHDPREFATALRAVGEPVRGRPTAEISVGALLDGLFAITRSFDMPTQPHLLLLQKTMVMVEGVAAALDPRINMWETAAPYVKAWVRDELGPEARLAQRIGRAVWLAGELPKVAERLVRRVPLEGAAPPEPPLPPLPAPGPKRWPALMVGVVLGVVGVLMVQALG